MQAELNNPIIAASIDPVLLPRLRELAATFPASFDREDELAGDIEAMAALLLDPRDLIAVEPEIDQRMDVFAAREMRRLEDVQRRNAIMIAP